ATTTQQYRSLSVCLALSLVPFRPQRDCNSPPRDDHPLASRGVPVVLARAITQIGWQAENLGRAAQSHRRDEPCKLPLGWAHLRRILGRYAAYYNESRIHRSLDKGPHSIGRLSASASSHRSLSSAAFITNIAESDFRHAQHYRAADPWWATPSIRTKLSSRKPHRQVSRFFTLEDARTACPFSDQSMRPSDSLLASDVANTVVVAAFLASRAPAGRRQSSQ